MKGERAMQEKEYQETFNEFLGKVMTMIELSGNEALKRGVRKAMFDFSDIIRERVIKGERENDRNFNR